MLRHRSVGLPVGSLVGAAVVAVALGALPAGAASTTTTTAAAGTDATGSTTTTTKPVSPKSLLATSLAAARSQKSVHFEADSTLGTQSIDITADVAATKSRETIVVTSGGQSGHVSARMVHRAVYFKGDTTGLEGYLGMASTLAPKYAGTWIRFSPSDPTYKAISKAMSMASAVGQISVKAPVADGGSSTINGKAVTSITGTTTALGSKGPAALYLPAQGTVLPLRYTASGTEKSSGKTGKKVKATGQVDFTSWGETFTVTAPAKSVAASSV